MDIHILYVTDVVRIYAYYMSQMLYGYICYILLLVIKYKSLPIRVEKHYEIKKEKNNKRTVCTRGQFAFCILLIGSIEKYLY